MFPLREIIDSNIAYVAPGQIKQPDGTGKSIYNIISHLRKRARVRRDAATREILKTLIPHKLKMMDYNYHAASLKDILFAGQDYM